MNEIDLTGKSPAQRNAIFEREARRAVEYITEDGRRVTVEQSPVERKLTASWPHPAYRGGLVPMDPNDEEARRVVTAELGHEPASEDEYLAALAQIAMEKGWVIRRKRGRPKGSRNHRPGKKRSGSRRQVRRVDSGDNGTGSVPPDPGG